MARTFNPQFAELLSEAFARAEIRPIGVTQEHIEEAIRSANYLLTDFSVRWRKTSGFSTSSLSRSSRWSLAKPPTT